VPRGGCNQPLRFAATTYPHACGGVIVPIAVGRARMGFATLALCCVAPCVVGAVANGQGVRGGASGFGRLGAVSDCSDPPINNIPYDGQFTFVRLRYNGGPGQCYYRGEPAWAHGYGYTERGVAEANLMKIVSEISVMHPHLNATNVLAIDDPELFKYPAPDLPRVLRHSVVPHR
jgi:hypothetical protein